MKILQVARQFFPAVGGIQTAVWQLSRCLQAKDHQVHVMALNRLFAQEQHHLLQPEEMIDGIFVRRISYIGPRQYAIAPGILRYVKEYDLIHLHSCDFFLDYLAWAKPIHRKPIVLSSHGVYFHTSFGHLLKQAYFRTLTRLDLRQVSAIVCVSDHDFQLLSRIAPPEKLYLIPNGIEAEKLSKLNVSSRDPDLLVSVGRLASNKRHDKLLRAFALVVKRHPMARLVLVGPDGGLLSSLKSLSADLNIVKQVEFVGKVSDDELLNYLECASVWLSASSYEAFGIALLEAMAAGCILVVQPLPSFRQLLTHNIEGFYANFDSPDEASEAILRSLDLAPADREKMVACARAKASEYSWGNIAKRILEVYKRAVETVEPQ